MSGVWEIGTEIDDLEEGLFGQVLLWVFEILPWLETQGVELRWDIRSRLYGEAPGHRVLPGVFDAAAVPAAGASVGGRVRRRALVGLRLAHVSVLGNDWQSLHEMWSRHFRVPARVLAQADAVGLPARTLGLHYRGTDKNLAALDTNPVSADDFLQIAEAYLAEHPSFDAVFIASDEPGMAERVAKRFPQLRVIGLGDIAFHKAGPGSRDKADRALLDCLLLSRCASVIKCSSALSGFAKVLNPALEIHRVAASKIFTEVPYFPDAHIPRLELRDAAAAAVLTRLYAGDWRDDPAQLARWDGLFTCRRRYGPARVLLNIAKTLAARMLGRRRKA